MKGRWRTVFLFLVGWAALACRSAEAGVQLGNHNETLVRDPRMPRRQS